MIPGVASKSSLVWKVPVETEGLSLKDIVKGTPKLVRSFGSMIL